MKNYVSINANDVRKMFKVCGACIDTSCLRECLQYIKIEVRGNKATAIGCDGFRHATVTSDINTKDGSGDFDFFVKPAKIDKDAFLVSFTINDDKSVTMSDGATSITTRYLSNYIEWERLFEMSEWIKPPLGVSPHWYIYNKRIKELSEAITRYSDFIMHYSNVQDGCKYYELISKWATEIKMLAEIEIPLLTADKQECE